MASVSYCRVRQAQVRASTLFGIALAILVALILATIFLRYILPWLTAKPAPAAQKAPPAKKVLAVAATNITDRRQIRANQVKNISVTEKEYNDIVDKAKARLKEQLRERFGSDYKPRDPAAEPLKKGQATDRTTVLPVRAEEPIFEDQLEDLRYPPPLRVAPGMRSVVVQVPARSTMVQVDQYVDVLCTMSHKALGIGQSTGTSTAVIAKGAKVLARFGSTRTDVRPPPGPKRPYTLEVTPYRQALIELAQARGATFSLSVVGGDEGSAAPEPSDTANSADRLREFNDYVHFQDLEQLFGLRKGNQGTIETWNGTKKGRTFTYTRPETAGAAAESTSANPRMLLRSSNRAATASGDSSTFGFGPPSGATAKGGCKTCGKGHKK